MGFLFVFTNSLRGVKLIVTFACKKYEAIKIVQI